MDSLVSSVAVKEPSRQQVRWNLEHWELYIIFSLEKVSSKAFKQISFLSRRRSYSRFDKDLAEEIVNADSSLSGK